MCCLHGRQAQFMYTDHLGPASCCKHRAGSSACSGAPRNVSALRAASCPDNVRLTFSCHSSIPDTLNILFTSESRFHIHGKLSISLATTDFYSFFFFFSPRQKCLMFGLVYLQGRTCHAAKYKHTAQNNAVIKTPSVRKRNGFNSANINYQVWTWQHTSIVLLQMFFL